MRLFGSIALGGLAGAGALGAALALPIATGAPESHALLPTDAAPATEALRFDEPLVHVPSSSTTRACPISSVPPPDPSYGFYFTRAAYSGRNRGWGGWGGRGSWSIDFPQAEFYFTQLVGRLVDIDVHDERGGQNPICLEAEDLRKYPFLYVVEPGGMNLSEGEVLALRSYLEAGGFMMMDDFWGVRETANVEYQLSRVLPGRPIVELTLDHELFRSVYDIDEIRQVPNVGAGRAVSRGLPGARTDEGDNSEVPSVRGILDDEGRLMVVINQNTDLGDAWEWREDPWYPLDYSTYAIQVGINTVIYAMTH